MTEPQPAAAHLGKYEILGLIGEGATASVYKARDTVLNRLVALKILKPALIADPVAFSRFAQEAQTSATIFHTHIAAVLDMGEAQGRYFIVLQYVPGQSLDKFIKASGPLPPDEVLCMADELGEALDYVHKKGYLHRDVKPSNIIRIEGGGYILTDFGLMRAMMSTGLTSHTGAILGTPSYIAPEIWLDQPAAPATDQYALACVVVEALTGKILFTGDTPPAIMTAHVLKGVQALDTGSLPETLLPVLRRALAKEPADRYPNLDAFSQALRLALNPPETPVPPVAVAAQEVAAPQEVAAAQEVAVPPEEVAQTQRPVQEKPAQPPKPIYTRSRLTDAIDMGAAPAPSQPGTQQKVAPSLPAVRLTKRTLLIGGIAATLLLCGCYTLMAILNGNWFTAAGSPTSVAEAPEATLAATVTAANPPIPTKGPEAAATADSPPIPTKGPEAAATAAPTAEPAVEILPEPGLLRVGLSYSIDTLDPQKAYGSGDASYLKLIYEGLISLNAKMEPIPAAADWYEISYDGREWTFHVRDGLTYSDGSLLNAKRFEYTLLRVIDPRTKSDYRYILDDVDGANALSTADPDSLSPTQLDELKSKVRVQALTESGAPCSGYQQADCTRLLIVTTNPAPHLPYILSMWLTYPAREEDILSGENWWMDPAHQIGNGPFIMGSFTLGQESYFSPNAAYWKGMPTYNVLFRHIQDPKALLDAYAVGELDVITVTSDIIAEVQNTPELAQQMQRLPGACSYALMFNQQREPFTDQRVREAFVYALDRKEYVYEALNGLGYPIFSWIPEGFPGYDRAGPRWDYDPDKAKQLLAEAGYPSPESLPPIDFTYGNSATNATRYEWLQKQYEINLGIVIKLNPIQYSDYVSLSRDPATAPQASIRGYCPDYPDPKEWLYIFKQDGYYASRIGYANPDFDYALDQAAVELDPAKRAELYLLAQRLLAQSVPMVELNNLTSAFLVKPWVTGYQSGWNINAFPGENEPLTIQVGKPE